MIDPRLSPGIAAQLAHIQQEAAAMQIQAPLPAAPPIPVNGAPLVPVNGSPPVITSIKGESTPLPTAPNGAISKTAPAPRPRRAPRNGVGGFPGSWRDFHGQHTGGGPGASNAKMGVVHKPPAIQRERAMPVTQGGIYDWIRQMAAEICTCCIVDVQPTPIVHPDFRTRLPADLETRQVVIGGPTPTPSSLSAAAAALFPSAAWLAIR